MSRPSSCPVTSVGACSVQCFTIFITTWPSICTERSGVSASVGLPTGFAAPQTIVAGCASASVLCACVGTVPCGGKRASRATPQPQKTSNFLNRVWLVTKQIMTQEVVVCSSRINSSRYQSIKKLNVGAQLRRWFLSLLRAPPSVEARLCSIVNMESRIAIALVAVALLCGAAPAVAQTKTQITVRRAPRLHARDVNPAVCSRLTATFPTMCRPSSARPWTMRRDASRVSPSNPTSHR